MEECAVPPGGRPREVIGVRLRMVWDSMEWH